ncbi:methyltransferase domain-containing protein [Streptacidiphilus sp. P02-A3a]|uniref:methyltransferase domain-containing protein n=1 Tax=Streptacidiphilus sp. P02-A3a TaxID=2704468 RepID=UPI0015FCC512|nr:methyltransferase domain-containing protein [Streptacidiphilus sp. P02-A3a]QMU67123.1 methyltransferase domain-containing protein [Streptacidiphilus sp. P02-A3a]
MTIIRSRESVRAFYTEAIESSKDTVEHLQAPVSEAFRRVLASAGRGTPRSAVDLGYGAGTHTIVLAQSGFDVLAVDQIPCTGLRGRIRGLGRAAGLVDVRQGLVEHFAFEQEFGVLVAKDVLHYLAKQQVADLLIRAVAASRSRNIHYLEVFTDIRRTSRTGEPVEIEGEAGYSTDALRQLLLEVYEDWDLSVSLEEHTEQDDLTGQNCFEATRVVAVAVRNTSEPEGSTR